MRDGMRDGDRLSEALRQTTVSSASAVLADAGITTKTKASYSSSLRRLDDVAIRAGHSEGMREKATFLKFLAVMVENGKGGTSTANSYRSALAWRQRAENTTIWATDEDVVLATKSVEYASREQGKPRGAITHEMIQEGFEHAIEIDEELAFLMGVQWTCGLRVGELKSLTVNCKSEDLLLLARDKRQRRGNAKATQQLHWKPIDTRAQEMVGFAIQWAKEQGRSGDDLLFTMADAKYRSLFKRVVAELGWEESLGLEFVPHSSRHGFVSTTTAAHLPQNVLERLGMGKGTAPRYAETNESRKKRAEASGSRKKVPAPRGAGKKRPTRKR